MHSQHVAPGRKARPETTAPILRGRGLVLARAGWALLFALNLGLFAAAVPALHAQRGAPSARPRAELAGLGISEGLYAAYFTALLAVFGLGCLAVAAVIVYRRSDEPIALFASAFLALLGAVNHPNLQALATVYPAWASLLKFSWWTLLAALILFVFLFPDGRFAPRWTRVPVFLFMGGMFVALFLGEGSITEPPEAFGLILLGGLVAGVAAQIYRYLRVASPEGRQQTKWVVTAITAAILTQVLVWSLRCSPDPASRQCSTTRPTSPSLPGYLLKGALKAEILRSIRAVVSGEAIFGPAIAKRLMRYFADPRPAPDHAFPELTGREREILGLLARHETNPEIARKLHLSQKTVRNHVSNIFTKLQVADRAQAAIRAREAGLGGDR